MQFLIYVYVYDFEILITVMLQILLRTELKQSTGLTIQAFADRVQFYF